MRRLRRFLLVGLPVLGVVLLLLAFFAPYLLKRYIEDHSEEWIARKVAIGHIILNPFTGTFGITDLSCTERNSDVRFVSWEKASLKWDMLAWWNHDHWRFHTIELRSPYVRVSQRGDRFNFTDLIELGGDEEPDPSDTLITRFDLEEMEVTNGRVDYDSDLLKAPVSAQALNVLCSRISSGSARMDFDLDFRLSTGGTVDGSFSIDTEQERYGINAVLKAVSLAPTLPYVQDLMDCSELVGSMDLDLDLSDSWSDTTALALRAVLGLRGLELKDPTAQRLLGLKDTRVVLDTLTARDSRFDLRTVAIDDAYARYEMYKDSTDNWSRLIKTTGTAASTDSTGSAVSESNVFVMLAHYIGTLAKEFIANEYTADSLSFAHGAVDFTDHTLGQPFHYTITELDLLSMRVNTADSAAHLACSALLNGLGKFNGALSIEPRTFKEFTAELVVEQFVMRDLDPYMQWYAAHPAEDGVLTYAGTTTVHDGHIDSKNSIHIERMKVGKKVDEHAADITVLPLRLGVSLLKDRHGVIALDLPVSGDINDPEFKPWPIVWKVLKNLLTKAISAPVNLVARAVDGVDPAELESVRFAHMQVALDKSQCRSLDQLAQVLGAKPELRVVLVPLMDERTEMQRIALFGSKATMLFGEAGAHTAQDSSRVENTASTDSAFVQFLNERTPSTKGLSEAERSLALLGADVVKQQCALMETARQERAVQYLLAKGVPVTHVSVRLGTAEEVGTLKGAPGYRYVYDAAP
jgi:Domain of Unknown Function (DUF748)